MTALRPALASVLLAVLAVGGVVLPAVHHAEHGLEVAEAQTSHAAHHAHDAESGDRGPSAGAPCPPAPVDVDCAVCVGVTAAERLAAAMAPLEGSAGTLAAYADWVGAVAAAGAGARAPPVG